MPKIITHFHSAFLASLTATFQSWQQSADIAPAIKQGMWQFLHGGKHLRATLSYAIGQTLGCKDNDIADVAIAIESIHSYSLIHDDLPAMDNDDWRRGFWSCHQLYGESTAILIGDALHAFAFEILSNAAAANSNRLAMIATLSQAIGAKGLISGQYLDLNFQKDQSIAAVKQMYQQKTGKLWTAIAQMLISNQNGNCKQQALLEYAQLLGIAFQLSNDFEALRKHKTENSISLINLLGKTEAKTLWTEQLNLSSSIISTHFADSALASWHTHWIQLQQHPDWECHS
jgi:geranylgeranyl pyrophosphate synthase